LARAFIGTSGYAYDHWKGVFYPDRLPPDRWLEFYAGHFDTVEINNTFYHLPTHAAFVNWRQKTPDAFTFAVKMSRYLTHIKRLKDPGEPLRRFFDNAAGLGSKLGPVLFQLPPNFKPDLGRLRDLLALRNGNMRWVLEFRNAAWFNDDVLAVLREAGVGFCVHDAVERCPAVATAGFAYVRFHGVPTYAGRYDKRTLRKWSRRMEDWIGDGLDVYAYFNNDAAGHAVENAKELAEMMCVTA